jgi:hypothetical protein
MGGAYALMADNDSVVAVLLEGAYRRADFGAFLAMLPAPEPAGDSMSRLELARAFKPPLGPLSRRDLALTVMAYVAMAVGFGMLIAGALALPRPR